MFSKHRRLTFALSTLCAWTVVGCAGWPLGAKARNEIARDERFPDIVVPARLSLVISKISSVETPGHRNFVLTYSGHMEPVELVRFFEDKLSIGGWQFVCVQTLGTRTFADFRKGNELCSVSIEKHLLKTLVTIRVREVPR